MIVTSLKVGQGEVVLVEGISQVVLAVIVVDLSASMLELENIVVRNSGSGVVVVDSS